MNNPDSDLEKRLWSSADKLRSNMDAAEYKHVVLGLIFLNMYRIHLRKSIENWRMTGNTSQILKTGMNTLQEMSSGSLPRQGGIAC